MLICPVQTGFLIECETPVSVLERLLKYPEWDSNPQQAGFEPTASASWAIGATREARDQPMIAVLDQEIEDVP